MTEPYLKPCPFCAGKAKLNTDGITSIYCQDCDMSFSNGYRSIIRLKGEWNTRPLDQGWNDAIRAAVDAVDNSDHNCDDSGNGANANASDAVEALLDQQPTSPWRDMESAPEEFTVVDFDKHLFTLDAVSVDIKARISGVLKDVVACKTTPVYLGGASVRYFYPCGTIEINRSHITTVIVPPLPGDPENG